MSPVRAIARRLLRPFIRRRGFARDEKGATAIEFALLALPFFTLIYAILEISIVFLAGQILDSAVQDASRQIRTGQALAAGWNVTKFREEVCKGLYGMFNCSAGTLVVKVSVVTSFATATAAPPISSECTPTSLAEKCAWTIAQTYDGGARSEIVLAQAYYKWPTLVNLPGFNIQTQAGGTRLLSAVRVFANEPF